MCFDFCCLQTQDEGSWYWFLFIYLIYSSDTAYTPQKYIICFAAPPSKKGNHSFGYFVVSSWSNSFCQIQVVFHQVAGGALGPALRTDVTFKGVLCLGCTWSWNGSNRSRRLGEVMDGSPQLEDFNDQHFDYIKRTLLYHWSIILINWGGF